MKKGNVVLLLVILLGLLAGCSSSQTADETKTEKITAATQKRHEAAKSAKDKKELLIFKQKAETNGAGMSVGGDPTRQQAARSYPQPVAKNGGGESAWTARWQNFMVSFKEASYSFNPPSPIKVAKPYTIHLWVDTTVGHQALAEELKKLVPRDASRVESGAIQISPVMKATLTGENFTIKPNSPEQQIINLAGRTIWSWEITPTWPGPQTLHLRLIAIPPEGITDPYTIPVPLDRTIEVKVTLWWLIDFFFDKYWKWLLGGLGTLLFTVLGWWWKKRSDQKN